MRHLRNLIAISLTLWALGATSASALTLEQIGSFDQPMSVTSDPEDPDRLLVAERRGGIKLVEGDRVSTFANLSSVVLCCAEEQGLASIALAPDFADTGKLYVAYTGTDGGDIHVDELTAKPDKASADISTRRSLLDIPHSSAANHNGGQLQFGPDGNLYISTGDGGGANDPFHNAQDPNELLGKILRIDPTPSGPNPYTVPLGNPFPGASPPADTIWSLGLRNPFRFSFDRLTGGMAIADVGQSAREEIDWAPSIVPGVVGGAGANYGWSCREGLLAGLGNDPACTGRSAADFVDPVFEYPHDDPGGGAAFGCSIIGGYVVRDPGLGLLTGRYVYTDFCTGDIRSLQLPAAPGTPATGDCSLGLGVDRPISFGEDSAGRIYLAVFSGEVYRLSDPPSVACPTQALEQDGEAEPALPTPVVGIKAERRRVRRGKPALIVAWVSPCEGQRGKAIRLLRGGRPNGSKFLSRACTVRFHPRIRHRTQFRAALVPSESDPLTAESRLLTIKIDHRRR